MIGWKMSNKDLEHHSNNDLIPFLFNLPLNPCGDSDLTNDDQDDDCCCCCWPVFELDSLALFPRFDPFSYSCLSLEPFPPLVDEVDDDVDEGVVVVW